MLLAGALGMRKQVAKNTTKISSSSVFWGTQIDQNSPRSEATQHHCSRNTRKTTQNITKATLKSRLGNLSAKNRSCQKPVNLFFVDRLPRRASNFSLYFLIILKWRLGQKGSCAPAGSGPDSFRQDRKILSERNCLKKSCSTFFWKPRCCLRSKELLSSALSSRKPASSGSARKPN